MKNGVQNQRKLDALLRDLEQQRRQLPPELRPGAIVTLDPEYRLSIQPITTERPGSK